MKILIIEDEVDLRNTVLNYLEEEGYVCEIAPDYSVAREKAGVYQYDCVLLDLTLPGGNGLDLIPVMKSEHPDTGIIILSARDSLDDRVKGLDLGADDYLTKPFHLSELNARVKSLLRRRQLKGAQELVFNEITIRPDSREVCVLDREVVLTPKEYGILYYFMVNQGRVIGKEALAEHIWGDQIDLADHFDFLYTHIKNLRKKLIESGAGDYIKTVYGMGYQFKSK
ncbi:MAG: response regulator transcription factor [Flavobacteriales bacterium]|nr:response regulator transcription factor [Flavobacteriales bacterium]